MLTEQEKEVVKWLAQGLSNKQIATQLDICEQTVKNHVSNAMRDQGVNNRVQLALSYWGYIKKQPEAKDGKT